MLSCSQFKYIDIGSDSIKSIILMYSQDDGRYRRSHFDKKRKKPTIRVGDDVDSPQQNQAPSVQDNSSLTSFTFGSNNSGAAIAPVFNMPPPAFLINNSSTGNLSLVTFNPGSAQSSGGFNQSVDSNPIQALGTPANMQRISQKRAQFVEISTNQNRPTAANPTTPNTDVKPTTQTNWMVPIDQRQSSPMIDEPYPSFLPIFRNAAENQDELGINPRKMGVHTDNNPAKNQASANKPIIATPLPPFKLTQSTTGQLINPNQPEIRENHFNLSTNHPQTQQNSPLQQTIAQNASGNNNLLFSQVTVGSQATHSLITFLQQQWTILTNNFNEVLRQWSANNRSFFNSLSPNIPPSQSTALDKLSLDFSIFDKTGLTKPYLIFDLALGTNLVDPQQISMLPSKIDYFMLIKYFISQQISKSKTVNLYLVLDRLKKSFASKTAHCDIDGKISQMKHLYPFLASIKKWKEVINLNINLLKQANQEIQSRHANLPTQVPQKATVLKTAVSQVKMSSQSIKAISAKCSLIAEQIKSSVELARNINNPSYSYTYPDQGTLEVFRITYNEYMDLKNKANQFFEYLLAQYDHPDQQPPSKLEILKLLTQKFNEASYNLIPIRSKVRQIRRTLTESKSWQNPNPFSSEWKTVELFREIERIMERRARK